MLSPPLGLPRPPLNAKARPLPRARIEARAFAVVESSGEVWMVLVLKRSSCGTSSSACTRELKRARNAKERSDFYFAITES